MLQPTQSNFAVAPIRSTAAVTTSAAMLSNANVMPTDRQTSHGVASKSNISSLSKEYTRQPQPMLISHPRQAPSTITSENFLAAKSLLSPIFQHNMSATKIARISNLHAEAPRFRDQVDILAQNTTMSNFG